MFTYDPEEDGEVLVTGIMLFDLHTRLMCPNCGTVSNNHKHSAPFFYQYKHSPFLAPRFVCYHTCHRCGYKDDVGSGFTDSGNYHCDQTAYINDWEEELLRLEDEVEELKGKLEAGKRRWAELWDVDTDAT